MPSVQCDYTPQERRARALEVHSKNAHYLVRPVTTGAEILGYDLNLPTCVFERACGIHNEGNTCWLNALVAFFTAASMCRTWSIQHWEMKRLEQQHPSDCLLCALGQDSIHITNNASTEALHLAVARTRHFWFPRYRHHAQEDPHEGWTALIDACNAADLQAVSLFTDSGVLLNSTPMWHMLGGVQASFFCCHNCGRRSVQYERFTALLLELPNDGTVSLADLLHLYTRWELVLDARCAACSIAGNCWKCIDIVRWPSTLILNFKRWERHQGGATTKLRTKVGFPLHWSPTRSMAYNVCGVLMHHGIIGHGHCTAYVKDDTGWFHYDDSLTPCQHDEATVAASDPYMLLYECCL